MSVKIGARRLAKNVGEIVLSIKVPLGPLRPILCAPSPILTESYALFSEIDFRQIIRISGGDDEAPGETGLVRSENVPLSRGYVGRFQLSNSESISSLQLVESCKNIVS
jgi:hypothetical protein